VEGKESCRKRDMKIPMIIAVTTLAGFSPVARAQARFGL
jgi:hypothetical protein